MSALAEYLRMQLKKRGWDQKTLAEKAYIAPSTLSNILNPKSNVIAQPSTIQGLAQALEVRESLLTSLLGYAVEDPPSPDDRYVRMARLISELPWLESGVEEWLKLPPEDQEDILHQIEYRRTRQKSQSSH